MLKVNFKKSTSPKKLYSHILIILPLFLFFNSCSTFGLKDSSHPYYRTHRLTKDQTKVVRVEKAQDDVKDKQQNFESSSILKTEIKQRYAVLIGISKYYYRGKWGLLNLRYADHDARALAEWLGSHQGGRFDHVKLLTNENATTKKIRIELMEELRAAQGDDMVFIFWGGHGSPDPNNPKSLYLITHDTDPEHMPATAISMQEFKQSITNLDARNIIIVADACHSAAITDPSSGMRGDIENTIVEGFRSIKSKKKSYREYSQLYFTSCEAKEKSQESSKLGNGHGVFTHYFLKGLKGSADKLTNNGNGDGIVQLGEMIDYTIDKVKRYTRGQQHPDTAGRFDRNLPLAFLRY